MAEHLGYSRFSPIGRFATVTPRTGSLDSKYIHANLEAGGKTPGPPAYSVRQVLDDRRVVIRTSGIEVWQPGGASTPLPVPSLDWMNPAGTVSVWVQDSKIHTRDLASSRHTLKFANISRFEGKSTADGQTLYFVMPAPVAPRRHSTSPATSSASRFLEMAQGPGFFVPHPTSLE